MANIKVFCVVVALLVSHAVMADISQSNTGYSRGVGGGGSGGRGGGGGDNGPPQPYSFQYEVKDQTSGNDYSQQESSDGNTVTGEYQVLLPDGRRQVVKYSANDQTGFVADVQYEGGGGGGGFGPPSPPGGSNTYLPPNGRK